MRKKLTLKRIRDKIEDTVYLYVRSRYNKLTRSDDYTKIKKYLMFVGYPRSGHSLIGAILDAHKNITLSHELDVLKYIRHAKSEKSIFSMIVARSEWFVKQGCVWKGYVYKVPNQWQGKYEELTVIGDKKGGATSKRLATGINSLFEIRNIIHKDIILIHVIRNPFDNITTRARGGSHVLREVNDELLLKTITAHFNDVEAISRIKKENKFLMLDIYNENFIADPKKEIVKICELLGVDANSRYLDDCASIVFTNPKKTRNQINWKPEFIQMVQTQIDKYDFLKGYNFYASIFFLFQIVNKYIACIGNLDVSVYNAFIN